jgi:hypothetical protein
MNADKYEYPNFFIAKEGYRKKSTGYISDVYYFEKVYGQDGTEYYSVKLEAGLQNVYGTSGIKKGIYSFRRPYGPATFTKEKFEKNFYHINRYPAYRRKYLFYSIFSGGDWNEV